MTALSTSCFPFMVVVVVVVADVHLYKVAVNFVRQAGVDRKRDTFSATGWACLEFVQPTFVKEDETRFPPRCGRCWELVRSEL